MQRARLYEEVVEQVVEMIRTGQIKPGERLPSERELESQIHVSRGVLREAFRVLESRGLINSRPGGGRFLRELPSFSPDQMLNSQLLTTKLEQAVILDLWETREALEAKAAELACLRRTRKDLLTLHEIAAGVLARRPIAEIIMLDKQFHLAIATAAHNSVLYNMMKLQAELLIEIRGRVLSGLGREEPQDFPRDHQMIVDAIEACDAAKARELIVAHLHYNRQKFESI